VTTDDMDVLIRDTPANRNKRRLPVVRRTWRRDSTPRSTCGLKSWWAKRRSFGSRS